MKCRDAAEFLADYVAGTLPLDTLERFERHLSRCPNCQRFLAQYVDTISAGRAAFTDPDAAAGVLPEELIEAILNSRL